MIVTNKTMEPKYKLGQTLETENFGEGKVVTIFKCIEKDARLINEDTYVYAFSQNEYYIGVYLESELQVIQ